MNIQKLGFLFSNSAYLVVLFIYSHLKQDN